MSVKIGHFSHVFHMVFHIHTPSSVLCCFFFFFAPLIKDEDSTLFKSLTNEELILYTQQKRQSHAFFPQKITSFSPDCKVAQGMENTEYTALEATRVTKKKFKKCQMINDILFNL